MYLSTKKHVAVLAALACLLLITPPAPAASPILGCEACLVLDASAGKVLYRRAIDRPLPNASTTKMMTALLVAESARPRELVRVSPDAASVGGGGLDLSPGDVYSVRDLLYALLLDSSNEAASALAEHVAGDVEDFVRAMNRRARELGATGTSFVNPHGLDAAGHASTARDLATIALELLQNRRLAAIVASPRRTISTPGGTATVENRNALLETYAGAIGVKTGQTLGAGEVLVAGARRGPRFLVAVAMRSSDAAADARRLLDYGFARLRRAAQLERERARAAAAEPGIVVAASERVGALVFDPAGATAVIAADEVSVPGAETSGDAITVVFTPSQELLLPLASGDQIGTVEVMSGDEVIATVPALAGDPIGVEDSSWGTRALTGLLRTAAIVMEGIAA